MSDINKKAEYDKRQADILREYQLKDIEADIHNKKVSFNNNLQIKIYGINNEPDVKQLKIIDGIVKSDKKLFIIKGAVGTGKTFLSYKTCMNFIEKTEGKMPVYMLSFISIIDIKYHTFTKDFIDILGRLYYNCFLVIDDYMLIGAKATEHIIYLIMFCYEKGINMLITTNIDIELDSRASSRIDEIGIIINYINKNYRKKEIKQWVK